jgi:endonuclease YncB( thermonuclease family)
MRALIAALFLTMVGPGLAAEIVVTDGDTFQLNHTIYRLDGIDAPEIDQTCLDQSGDVWPCGVTARDRLRAYIGNRAVSCEDKGADPVYKHRRIGICSIESEPTTLNEWLVREGWAIKFEPSAKGRFAAEEADARENRRGLWNGCFADARPAGMESQWSATCRRRLSGWPSEPNTRKAIPRRHRHAAGMPDQGQAGAAGRRLRRHLSPAGLRELSTTEAG